MASVTRRIRFNPSDGPMLPRSSSSSGYSKGKSSGSYMLRNVVMVALLVGSLILIGHLGRNFMGNRALKNEEQGPADHWGSHEHHYDDSHQHFNDHYHYSDHDHFDNPHGHHQYNTGRDHHIQEHHLIQQHGHGAHVPADDGSLIINTAGDHAAAAAGSHEHGHLPPAHAVGVSGPSPAAAVPGSHPAAEHHDAAVVQPPVAQQPPQQQQQPAVQQPAHEQHVHQPPVQQPATQQQEPQQQEHHAQREADVLPEWSADGTAGAQHHEEHAVVRDPYTTPQGLYTLTAKDIDGIERKLSDYTGMITLVVNVASHCGFTDANYKGLQQAYDKYRQHGLEILAFPCNQFGNQEPGADAEVKSWAHQHYNVTFPMFSKVDVNGPNAHPVFKFIQRELPIDQGGGGGTAPGRDFLWNFQKVLINRHGQPVKLINQEWHQGIVEHAIYDLLVNEQ